MKASLKIEEQEKTKLRECPFCGSKVNIRIAPLMKTVMFVCPNCGADVCFYGGEHEPQASMRWNRRANESNVND